MDNSARAVTPPGRVSYPTNLPNNRPLIYTAWSPPVKKPRGMATMNGCNTEMHTDWGLNTEYTFTLILLDVLVDETTTLSWWQGSGREPFKIKSTGSGKPLPTCK